MENISTNKHILISYPPPPRTHDVSTVLCSTLHGEALCDFIAEVSSIELYGRVYLNKVYSRISNIHGVNCYTWVMGI